MRTQLLKLKKGKSTKAERKFSEILKAEHIPFRSKVLIGGREIDFLIGRYAIEIDSHDQDVSKNTMLVNEGYHPFHLASWKVNDSLRPWVRKLCHQFHKEQISE